MNIKIILTGGGSAVANRLMTQAIAKIPPTIDCIFPAIEAYIVTPEELNTRLVRNLCGGIHFMHGPKKSWYLAAMPRKIERNGDACTILLTASTIQSQEELPVILPPLRLGTTTGIRCCTACGRRGKDIQAKAGNAPGRGTAVVHISQRQLDQR